MKKSIELYYDMDEVINYFSKSIIEQYNRDFNDDLDWRSNTSWGWGDAQKAKLEYFRDLLHKKGTFLNIEPNEDAIKYMLKLHKEDFSINIITAPEFSQYCAWEKIQWIERYLPWFDIENNLHLTKSKYKMAKKNRILLDDNSINLILWQRHGGLAIAYDFPWNQELKEVARVFSHKEFYYYIKEYEAQETRRTLDYRTMYYKTKK